MSKRELETLAQVALDIGTPRAKRRRETPADDSNSNNKASTSDVAMHKIEDGQTSEARGVIVGVDIVAVKEQASQLWHAVKDATAAECVTSPH
jgi:hypothetical protein